MVLGNSRHYTSGPYLKSMGIEQKIRKATCRVDGGGHQLGSSFWVDDQNLVTAAHVIEEAPGSNLELQAFDGENLEAEVVATDPGTAETLGSDLALVEVNKTPSEYEILDIETTVPSIGTEVLWSGYAKLFGEERIDRQRFGWGNVASETYGNGRGSFFEVDGLFNPSHSGGPVVDVETGNVVGIVSASAGRFDDLVSEWSELVSRLTGLFKVQQQGDNIHFRTLRYSDPGKAFQEKAALENLGLDTDIDVSSDPIELTFSPPDIPIQAGFVQAEISKLLFDTAQRTFQMGVGIASGGEKLHDMLSQR